MRVQRILIVLAVALAVFVPLATIGQASSPVMEAPLHAESMTPASERPKLDAVPTESTGPVDVDPHDLAGSGTRGDPYVVTNASELQAISEDLLANYTLGTDIDAAGTALWNDGAGFDPIGTSPLIDNTQFRGTFNGAGHIITGLTIHRPETDFVGLFAAIGDPAPGIINGTVRNVTLRNVSITGRNVVGGLAGQSDGRVSRISINGTVTATEDSVGGLVGLNNELVHNVSSSASVDGLEVVGGLAGENYNAITAEEYDGVIRNAYATGPVNGTKIVGGFVGINDGKITQSFTTGPVSGDAYVGGFAAQVPFGVVEASYWDMTGTGENVSGGNATGLTTVEMIGSSARVHMAALRFESVWQPRPKEYPVLEWQRPPRSVLSVASATVPRNRTTQLPVTLSAAPYGVSGFNLTIAVKSGLRLTGGSVSPLFNTSHEPVVAADNRSIRLEAVDLSDNITSGAMRVHLGSITIRGIAVGNTSVSLTVTQLDADGGIKLTPRSLNGTITVIGPRPLADDLPTPTDPDDDGRYEDLNGNGRIDYDDVVILFRHRASAQLAYQDFNDNGRTDFDDIIALFEEV